MPQENMVVVFVFNVKRGKSEQFVDSWNEGVNWLKNQSGWVGEMLVQSHDDAGIYMSAQEWTSANAFRDAASNPKFQAVMNTLPVRDDVTVASYSVVSKDAQRKAA